MFYRLLSLLLLSFLLASCGGRAAGPSADTGPDRGARDGPPAEVSVKPDTGGKDTGGKDTGGGPTFCKGPPAAEANGQKLPVTGIQTQMNLVGACCPPGEILSFETTTPQGTKATLRLEIARFPGVTIPKRVDLANAPGWVFIVRCDPPAHCGMVSSTNSTFEGWLELEQLVGGPAVQLTVCLSARPKNPTNPNARPVKLWASKQHVNRACVPGMDQTCNHDPKISSLRGKCNPDSTCTCNPGSQKMVNGKCR